MIEVSIDKEAHAMYIKLTQKKIVRTETTDYDINIDLDEWDQPIGFEILNDNI